MTNSTECNVRAKWSPKLAATDPSSGRVWYLSHRAARPEFARRSIRSDPKPGPGSTYAIDPRGVRVPSVLVQYGEFLADGRGILRDLRYLAPSSDHEELWLKAPGRNSRAGSCQGRDSWSSHYPNTGRWFLKRVQQLLKLPPLMNALIADRVGRLLVRLDSAWILRSASCSQTVARAREWNDEVSQVRNRGSQVEDGGDGNHEVEPGGRDH